MMKGIIRAIALSALVQVAIGTGLTCWLFNHNNDMALQYAQMAERNANAYTDEQVLQQYNRLQVQFSNEREDMRQYVQKTIELRGVKQ